MRAKTASHMAAILSTLLLAASAFAQTRDSRGMKVRSAEQSGMVGYDPARFHALVIGINDYSQWTKLRTAVNDATAVADALVSNYGFPAAQVRRLLDENATRRNILKELDRLSDLGPEDSVLIYYAGHGWMDRRKNGFWIPVDAPEDDKFAYVSNAQIVQECFKKYRVKHLLVVSDSCFSGALLRGKGVKRDANWKIPAGFQKPSRWVITSGDLAPVPDDAGTGHSPFATRLLQYLRYGDEPAFGIYDLFSFVKHNLESGAICEPLDTPAHMPGGEFVLARLDSPITPQTYDRNPQTAELGQRERQAEEQHRREIDDRERREHGTEYRHGKDDLEGQDGTDVVQTFRVISDFDGVCNTLQMNMIKLPNSSVWMSDREVSNMQYRMFKPHHDSRFISKLSLNGDHYPVVYVTYADAAAFCRWLTLKESLPGRYRLPSTDEWIAGWADDVDYPPKKVSMNIADASMARSELSGFSGIPSYDDGFPATSPCGYFPYNLHGFYDMLGNVREWTSTQDVSGYHFAIGNSWRSQSKPSMKSDYGQFFSPEHTRNDEIGFRIVYDPSINTP